MAVWSELCKLVRWLLRRPEPPPPPGTGQRYQATEQAEAQRRLLDQAERLRRTQWYCEPTQPKATHSQPTGNGTRGRE
ncbi:hypothetical protein [Micromonospora deserti]|uniref:Uncharacterized protein n=1 Tax=Micromonospora deserti TaxID=2070366 RepID=A0A2W2DG00_9ACTN|nr:hypothetical protein [Micromonospora deserti]PZF96066.1 hypothetical protein C1I99_17490 [Micromonospora deserti]